MGRVVFIQERNVEGVEHWWRVFIQEREERVWKVWSTGGESSVYSREKCGRYGALVRRVVFIQERSVEGVEHWWGE